MLQFAANQIGVPKVSHNIGSAQMTKGLWGHSYQKLTWWHWNTRVNKERAAKQITGRVFVLEWAQGNPVNAFCSAFGCNQGLLLMSWRTQDDQQPCCEWSWCSVKGCSPYKASPWPWSPLRWRGTYEDKQEWCLDSSYLFLSSISAS